jgi:tyrosyl-tRNA synthetase
MSSSDPNSKIDFLDPPASIRKKIKSAFCEEGNTEENGVLAFVNAVLIPISSLRIERRSSKADTSALGEDSTPPFISDDAPPGTLFTIPRDIKWGGSMHFESFAALENDFKERRVHPGDLKNAVAEYIVQLLDPVQKAYAESEDWQVAAREAYPEPVKEVKKKKVAFFPNYLFEKLNSFTGENLLPSPTWEGQERCERWDGRCDRRECKGGHVGHHIPSMRINGF